MMDAGDDDSDLDETQADRSLLAPSEDTAHTHWSSGDGDENKENTP